MDKRRVKKKNKVGQIVSIFSFLLFISVFIISFVLPKELFKPNSLRVNPTENLSMFLLILSLIIPPIYFYLRWVFHAIKQRKTSILFFRLSFLIIILSYFGYQWINSEIEMANKIGNDLGIKVPYWSTSFVKLEDNISFPRGEGAIDATITFSPSSMTSLKDQISQSKYFSNEKVELIYCDDCNWSLQDSTNYWSVRNYLEINKLTGLWMYNSKKSMYEFYEPNLSDISNSGILFHENYNISAEFDPKNKTLTYKRVQF